MPSGGHRNGAKQRKPTALQKALAKNSQQEEEKVRQPEEEHSPTKDLMQQDHAWVDILLRFIDDSETFDPNSNTTTRTLGTHDDWTVINTTDLAGEQLQIRLDPAQLVGDLKAEVAKRRGSSSGSQVMVVVHGNAADDSMSIAELLASASESPIYCWQKVNAKSSETMEMWSERSTSEVSANSSLDLYGTFLRSDFRNLEESATPRFFFQDMQLQIADLEERDRAKTLIIASHEMEMASLRKSVARCAENPGSIFGKSAAILAQRMRSMLARVRLKHTNASLQLQCIVRGWQVRNILRKTQTEVTKIQAAWRGLLPRQKLAGLLQAIRPMQRIHRERMERKDMRHQFASATKIQSVWRVVPHKTQLVETLRVTRSMQRITRGELARKNLALQQRSAALIANTFRRHTSNIHAQYGALYSSNQELLREKKELANAKQGLMNDKQDISMSWQTLTKEKLELMNEQTQARKVEAHLKDTIVQLEKQRASLSELNEMNQRQWLALLDRDKEIALLRAKFQMQKQCLVECADREMEVAKGLTPGTLAKKWGYENKEQTTKALVSKWGYGQEFPSDCSDIIQRAKEEEHSLRSNADTQRTHERVLLTRDKEIRILRAQTRKQQQYLAAYVDREKHMQNHGAFCDHGMIVDET
jgi:hypothetical protein